MKVDDAVETLTRFFNDLIGSFVPGVVLAFGFCIMHLGPSKIADLAKSLDGAVLASLAVGLMFAVGHTLLALHEHAFQKALWACHLTKKFDEDKAKDRQSYKSFLDIVQGLEKESDGQSQAPASWGYHDLRSVALTVSAEGATLGRRFMFISLLCNGVGTAMAIIALDYIACLAFAPKLLYPYAATAPWAVQIALMLLSSVVLFKQGETFYGRAMATPFSIAMAEIKLKRAPNAPK
jgi:hypothetical protein